MPNRSSFLNYRGNFHYSAPSGWINDPNGFSWFGGRYHLFYQHYPHDSVWGPMHWGHAVSQDLVSWDTLPVALTPTEAYEANGCFSGSAAEESGQHLLMYTGHVDPEPGNMARKRQVQCLAWGDGEHYTKDLRNPVIGENLLPSGASHADFRDPKIWREGNCWYCLVANRYADGNGQLLLFSAEDIGQWRFVGTVLRSEGRLGAMWECPDLLKVEGREILLWSVVGMPTLPGQFQNSHSVVWASGSLDRQTGAFASDNRPDELDHGPDFYAPQSLITPDGRTVLIGWMQMWRRSMPTHDLGLGWAGQMTVPREVFWLGNSLAQKPVTELYRYRKTEMRFDGELSGAKLLPRIVGSHLDIEAEFRALNNEPFGLRLLSNAEGTEYTEIRYDTREQWLILDRSRSGYPIASLTASHPETSIYRAKVEIPEGVLRLRILVDRSSVEIFAQGGVTVMASTVYPRHSGELVVGFIDAGSVYISCRAWSL